MVKRIEVYWVNLNPTVGTKIKMALPLVPLGSEIFREESKRPRSNLFSNSGLASMVAPSRGVRRSRRWPIGSQAVCKYREVLPFFDLIEPMGGLHS